ncbi:MAG: hypothetical protein K1X78_16310 [Verrucomicrobiaceae bacterium]|nr:hypothetical protein [Verrucomicrobiaceae bacterium]
MWPRVSENEKIVVWTDRGGDAAQAVRRLQHGVPLLPPPHMSCGDNAVRTVIARKTWFSFLFRPEANRPFVAKSCMTTLSDPQCAAPARSPPRAKFMSNQLPAPCLALLILKGHFPDGQRSGGEGS